MSVLPDNLPSARRGPQRPGSQRPGPQRPRRARLALAVAALLVLLLAVLGVAWERRPLPPAPFAYLHGALNAPGRGADEVVFQLNGSAGTRSFTLAQLKALPTMQYRATQPQLKQRYVYTGVPLRDLAALAGLSGQPLRVLADDNFGATIAPEDYQTYPVMLAYLADGQPMTAALKGPLQVVFPNEQYGARFLQAKYGSQWVWFAVKLVVVR